MEEKRAEAETWDWKPGYGWRAGVSIVSFFGLIVFIIIWLFFYAEAFSIYQNIAIVISALLVSFAVIAAAWASMWMGCRRKK